MNEKLITEITKIRKNSSFVIQDEASIKSGVILNFLSILGWNPFDVEEVKPEYTVGSKRVDFSLRINATNKVFIEVKRPNEDLERHQEQLLDYSFREGVKIAILTNGMTWWFYLPLHEGGWEDRRFFTADLSQQDPTVIAERFASFLSRQNIMSGDAVKNAERLYTSHQKRQILKETLPKAWHKIITDPDDLLVELLVETTEKISGFRPEISDVEEFLSNIQSHTLSKPQQETAASRLASSGPKDLTSLGESYLNRTAQSFTLLGKTYHPHSWRDILITVSEEMYRKHSIEFDRCLSLRGPKMLYFSLDVRDLKVPARIANSKYFVETKFSSDNIVKHSRQLMDLFGYGQGDFTVIAI